MMYEVIRLRWVRIYRGERESMSTKKAFFSCTETRKCNTNRTLYLKNDAKKYFTKKYKNIVFLLFIKTNTCFNISMMCIFM